MSDQRSHPLKRVIVPLVLAVTVAGTVATAVTTAVGCTDTKPKLDAGVGDGGTDTPIV